MDPSGEPTQLINSSGYWTPPSNSARTKSLRCRQIHLTLIFQCCWVKQPHRNGASTSLKDLTGNRTGLTWSMYCGNLRRLAKKERCELRWNRIRHRMMHNAAGMLRIVDQIDSKAIGLNLDPSHLFPMGELPNMVAYEVGDRIFTPIFLTTTDRQTLIGGQAKARLIGEHFSSPSRT